MMTPILSAAQGRSDFLANLGSNVAKKADGKYQSRWTLADWFDTQHKTRLQDMWLAGNRSEDIYEFMLGGRTGQRTVTIDTVEQSARVRMIEGLAHAYATFAGLEGSYVDFDGDSWGWDGFLGFRPFGDSQQNTNVTLLYGLQFRSDRVASEEIQNSMARARLTLYLNKAVGLEGFYQWVFPATSNSGASIEGSRVEGGAFLDFSVLRVFGAWTREFRYRTVSSVRSERIRESIDVGLKLFF